MRYIVSHDTIALDEGDIFATEVAGTRDLVALAGYANWGLELVHRPGICAKLARALMKVGK